MTPEEITGKAAAEMAAANPSLRTEAEQRAFIEGFLNGSHWSFCTIANSVGKWAGRPELKDPKDADATAPT